jgi:hypothetical protein
MDLIIFPHFYALSKPVPKNNICWTFQLSQNLLCREKEHKVESQAYWGFCSSFLILTWMILRTPCNIPVDAILGAFQMYSIYFIYKTNEEEQSATAYVRISLTQNIHSQALCTSPAVGEAGDQSQCCNCLWSVYWFADSFVRDICSIKPHVEKGECAMSFQLQGCSMLSTPQWQQGALFQQLWLHLTV